METNHKSLLIVDDDATLLKTFSRILQKAGYNVEIAETCGEALQKIQTQTFHAALIDVVLQDCNGLDLLPKIEETSPKTVKIVITGTDLPENRAKASNYGADAYLSKPVKPEILMSIIDEKLKTTL